MICTKESKPLIMLFTLTEGNRQNIIIASAHKIHNDVKRLKFASIILSSLSFPFYNFFFSYFCTSSVASLFLLYCMPAGLSTETAPGDFWSIFLVVVFYCCMRYALYARFCGAPQMKDKKFSGIKKMIRFLSKYD